MEDPSHILNVYSTGLVATTNNFGDMEVVKKKKTKETTLSLSTEGCFIPSKKLVV
jgi:hypothetical protein